ERVADRRPEQGQGAAAVPVKLAALGPLRGREALARRLHLLQAKEVLRHAEGVTSVPVAAADRAVLTTPATIGELSGERRQLRGHRRVGDRELALGRVRVDVLTYPVHRPERSRSHPTPVALPSPAALSSEARL